MSEENVPVVNQTPDVEETPETLQAKVEEVAEKVADKVEEAEAEVVAVEKTAEEVVEEAADEAPVDLGSLSLAELSDMFDKLSQDENRMRRYKEAEAIKSAFYKRLSKEKADAGLGAKVDEPSSREDVIEEVAPAAQAESKDNPFDGFQRLLFYFAFLTLFGMTSGSTIESSIKPAYSPSSYQGVWKISFFTPSFSTV